MTPDPLSSTFAALADPTRRAILARLISGEASVTELAKPFEMSMPAVSKHLKVLERAGLIARGREAQWRPCRLEPPASRMFPIGWSNTGNMGTEPRSPGRIPAQAERKGEETWPQRSIPVEDTSGREIVITRVFDAPRDLVWDAWTDPKQVVQWWGPQGFTTTIHEMDVRPGGVWRHTMHGPDGTEYPEQKRVYRSGETRAHCLLPRRGKKGRSRRAI